jgi:hypothetical protein
MTQRLVLFSCLLAFLAPACQDYNYEELRGTTFREIRTFYEVDVSAEADILFIIDNSGSMAGEQRQLAESFRVLTEGLALKFGDEYRIAIITTGMESQGCPRCDPTYTSSCTNETGENGRFQDRICRNVGTDTVPEYVCESPPQGLNCRVVDDDNTQCFYDAVEQKGTLFVGVRGCGFERGFAPMRSALGALKDDYNDGFLREDATLAVVVISDEDDCGEVGDVYEYTNDGGNVCYFASRGEGPEGETSHNQDPQRRPYVLTPVEDYYSFLVDDVKGGRKGKVKFVGVVGMKDKSDPSTTTIEYEMGDRGRWEVADACTTPNCTGEFCFAEPGTRYIEMAQMLGIGRNGLLDTICQDDFSETLEAIVDFIPCTREFRLKEPPLDPALAAILIDGEEIPRHTCSVEGRLEVCEREGAVCQQGGECVQTWIYCDPDDPDPHHECLCDADDDRPYPECAPLNFAGAEGGIIVFADHYDPCKLIDEGTVHIEFVYVLPP